ncbi:MAG TPA: SDR family NAD(P)-dependent oxidoreductase [Aldersonia sp.]
MAGVDERVVIVTGAGGGGGLGREYAKSLAARGAYVVVNDLGGARDGSGAGSEMADVVVSEIKATGGEAVANYDSVATREGASALIQTALETFGAVHGVVSNAGILRDSSFANMTDEQWDAVIKVHLYGGYNVIREAWPHFRKEKFGRIVVATSTSGLYGNFGQANYGAAKMGLVGLINTLATEGAKHGITANAVAPLAATRMTEDVAPAEFLAQLPASFVAPFVTHLMSEECTDSAAVLVVGGGQVQRVQQFANAGVRFALPPTSDELADRWADIIDMSAAVPGKNPLG